MTHLSTLRQAVSYSVLSVALASCSLGGLMTSFSIDTSDNGQPAVTRSEEVKVAAKATAIPPAAATPEPAPPSEQSIEQLIAESEPQEGTSIDSYLGFAESEQRSTEAAIASDSRAAASQQATASASSDIDPGIDPIETASLLPLSNPGAAADAPLSPKKERIPGLLPFAERQCRNQLSEMGVTFADVEAIASGDSCGIAYPVKLRSLSGGVNVSPNVTVNCQTALAFAQWVQNEVAPAVRVRYLTGLDSVQTMGGYSCRRINGARPTKTMSEHATGNAIDIGGFKLNNGKEIDVSKQGLFAFRAKGLLKSIRASSCGYFSTVLGPGYPKHDDHFHFDLKSRSSDRTYCK